MPGPSLDDDDAIPAAGLVAKGQPGDNAAPLTITEISNLLKRTVEDRFGFVRLRGELSGVKRAASGHLYACLKDEGAVIDGVMWRTGAQRLSFVPEDGIEVVASGKLTTYPGRSKYQIVIETMEIAAEGALLALLVLLAVESLSAFPDFLPFFNVAVGGARGGFYLLSDSNLDWGQDLPALAAWQDRHPGRPLYLAYFGNADPASYGIRYHNLPAGYRYGPPPESLPARGPATVAISASILQGLYGRPEAGNAYAPFRDRSPDEVLGGSIYLFDLDAPP